MNENIELIFSFMAGLGLGVFFFYGLWKTIKIIMFSKRPSLWLVSSSFLRISITLSGFYFIGSLSSDVQLRRLIICICGFLLARILITRRLSLKMVEINSES